MEQKKGRGRVGEGGAWSQHFKCVLVEIVKFSYGTIMMRHQFGFYVEAVRIFQRGLINSCRTVERVGRRGKSPQLLPPPLSRMTKFDSRYKSVTMTEIPLKGTRKAAKLFAREIVLLLKIFEIRSKKA